MGRRDYIATGIVCLEPGGINNDLGDKKKIIFSYGIGAWLVFVVGELGKKAPFCGGCLLRSDGVLPLSANCNFSPWILAFVND